MINVRVILIPVLGCLVFGCASGSAHKVSDKHSSMVSAPPAQKPSKAVKSSVKSSWGDAERLVASGNNQEAAKLYLQLADAFSGTESGAIALNNAGVAYARAGDLTTSVKMYQKLLKQYPKFEMREEVLKNLGRAYNRLSAHNDASKVYAQLFNEMPKSDSRPSYLFLLAYHYEEAGLLKEAAGAYEKYAALYPEVDETSNHLAEALRIYRKLNDDAGLVRVAEEAITRYKDEKDSAHLVLESWSELAEHQRKKGQAAQAKESYGEVLKHFKERRLQPGSSEAVYAAAAAFQLAEYEFDEFKKIEIANTQEAAWLKIVQAHKESLDALKEKYMAVWAYKILDWTVAADYRRAYLRELMAKKLRAAAIPASMAETPLKLEVYRDMLEKICKQWESQALGFYEFALAKAKKASLSTEWTKRLEKAIEHLGGSTIHRPLDTKKRLKTSSATRGAIEPGAVEPQPSEKVHSQLNALNGVFTRSLKPRAPTQSHGTSAASRENKSKKASLDGSNSRGANPSMPESTTEQSESPRVIPAGK